MPSLESLPKIDKLALNMLHLKKLFQEVIVMLQLASIKFDNGNSSADWKHESRALVVVGFFIES